MTKMQPARYKKDLSLNPRMNTIPTGPAITLIAFVRDLRTLESNFVSSHYHYHLNLT